MKASGNADQKLNKQSDFRRVRSWSDIFVARRNGVAEKEKCLFYTHFVEYNTAKRMEEELKVNKVQK